MAIRKNDWAWPDVHTGVGTRTTGANAAFSDRMDAEDVTDQRSIGAFEYWNSGYRRHEQDTALDPERPRMEKVFNQWNSMSRRGNEDAASDAADVAEERAFACWNSGYQRHEEGPESEVLDASARRAFELWDSGRTRATEAEPLEELHGGHERMSEAVERLYGGGEHRDEDRNGNVQLAYSVMDPLLVQEAPSLQRSAHQGRSLEEAVADEGHRELGLVGEGD